jgi:hypothetical protein
MAGINDILEEEQEQFSDEALLNYLSGQLTGPEAHAIEAGMANDGFTSDAMEGLQHFAGKDRLHQYVQQLNGNLHKQLDDRKKKPHQRRIPSQFLALIAVILTLLLCIIAFVVIRMHHTAQP